MRIFAKKKTSSPIRSVKTIKMQEEEDDARRWIPKLNGRQDEMAELLEAHRRCLRHNQQPTSLQPHPKMILISGKSGTGKVRCFQYVQNLKSFQRFSIILLLLCRAMSFKQQVENNEGSLLLDHLTCWNNQKRCILWCGQLPTLSTSSWDE
jgi:hypothetical protein